MTSEPFVKGSFYLPQTVYQRLQAEADQQFKTVSEHIRQILVQHVKESHSEL